MKLIIAGSRELQPSIVLVYELMFQFGLLKADEIVSGDARGVDRVGKELAKAHEKRLTVFPADWENNGKAAGIIRNTKMAKYADALLLIWDGKSRGSANMKAQMRKEGKPIYECIITKAHSES